MTTVKKKATKKAVKKTVVPDVNSLPLYKQKFYTKILERTLGAHKNKEVIRSFKQVEDVKQEIEEVQTRYESLIEESRKKHKEEEPEAKKTKSLNSKAKKIEELIGSGTFGCQTDSVAKLCSEILGEEINPNRNRKSDLRDDIEIFEDERDMEIENIISHTDTQDISVFPTGTVFVTEEESCDFDVNSGTYMIVRDPCSDGAFALDNRGDAKYIEYVDFLKLHIADKNEVFAFIKGCRKNFFSEDNYLI